MVQLKDTFTILCKLVAISSVVVIVLWKAYAEPRIYSIVETNIEYIRKDVSYIKFLLNSMATDDQVMSAKIREERLGN